MTELNTNKKFINDVLYLKQSNIDTYKQARRITADFRMEKATTKSYNGRQILELLQNCDDALIDSKNGDCVVDIELDTKNNILRVSNYGAPFTIDGIGSLLIANTSSKGREFIGNKGLGFRSVLNWVKEIKLYTQGCVLSFSKQLAEDAFKALVLPEERQTLIENNKEHLDKNEVPMAVLSMPKIIENNEQEKYSTTVELLYHKEKEDDIKLQLNQLNTKLLLFLNHIRKIRVELINEEQCSEIKIIEEQSNNKLIVTNNGTWNLNYSGDVYFDKKEENERYYRIKLAWQDDLSDVDSKFYTYFPTAVPTNLPCLIHATFDLDPTRNYLNKSDNGENQAILRHIAQMMKETALSQLCRTPVNWQPYTFLQPQNKNGNELLNEFYNLLQNYREKEAIYPCVNNSYISINEAVFHGDNFSKWVLANNLGDFFPRLLYPKNDIEVDVKGRYSFKEWENIIENINPHLNVDSRTELIGHLIKGDYWNNFFKEIHESNQKLSLLLDNDEEVVKASKQVFTKDTEDISYRLPSYVDDIAFISTKLYDKIKSQLSDEIKEAKLDAETGPSRAIKRLLSKVVNIGSDDIIDVIDLIVKQTNRELEVSESKLDTVNEMLLTLFSIFLSNPERRGKLSSIKSIPLVTRNLTIEYANKLFFGKEYQSGVETEFIFDGIYDDEKYIADAEILGFDNDNCEFFDSFFIWLGVNQDVILERKNREVHDRYANWDYAKFVSTVTKLPEKVTYYSCNNFLKISNFDDVKKLTVNKIFRLLIKNQKLFETVLSDAEFTTKYGNEYEKPVQNAPNYIIFQLNSIFNFSTYIIDKNLPKNLGFSQIEFDETVNNDTINRQVLLANKLGVNTSFNKLPLKIVINALKKFGEQDENAANSQEFYKLINEYFKENEEKLKDWKLDTSIIKYFSRKGGVGRDLRAIEAKDVYYSDNKLLPQKVLDNYWFINLPKRIGENQISNFFGVKLIKNAIRDTRVNVSKINELNTDFGNYINGIKPYLLCYRLQSLRQNQNKKNEANLIKPIVIKLVTKATIEFDNKTPVDLENYDFIPDGNTFILRYNAEISIDNLQHDALFCDAIAEMCCIIFKVQDLKNTFRRIFKDGIKETAHLIKTDELEEYLLEAKKLLGISVEEQQFWRKIFPNSIKAEIYDEKEFRNQIQLQLNDALPDNYSKIDFSNLGNQYGIEFLNWLSGKENLDLRKLISANTLAFWHKENLKNHIRNYSKVFEYNLWKLAEESNNQTLKEAFFKQSIEFEDAVELDKFNEFLVDNQFNISPEYKPAIHNFALNKFNISLNGIIENIPEISNRYVELFKKYRFGHSVEDMENILKAEKPSIHSLIFFDGYTDIIKENLDKLELQNNDSIEDEEKEGTDDELLIVHSGLSKAIPANNSNWISSGSFSHNSKGDKKKVTIGKRIEKRVVKALSNQGYEVRNVAQKRDSKHYDLEYKTKDSNEWRYLEVKKDSGGFFFLSKAEKEAAMKKENRGKYDIAIVNGNSIHIIENPFNFQDESFENNSTFYAEPTEYKISFNISEK